MDGSIKQLNCRYRVHGARDAAPRTALRLDRLARDHLAASLASALDQALGDDETVYVLRRVRARVGLRFNARITDEALARRWAAALVAAVARTIAHDAGAGNLVRFADQPDYVVHFVRDLLAGQAWIHWYYEPFSALRPLGTTGALHTVLMDNRQHLPAILSRLHQARALAPTLAALGEAGVNALWETGLEGASGAGSPALRPVFVAALALVSRLELWAPERPEDERLLAAYLDWGALPVDWRDRRGLAAGLLAALHFLAQRGHLQRPHEETTAALQARLDPALAELDWLDGGWLGQAVAELLLRSSTGGRDTSGGAGFDLDGEALRALLTYVLTTFDRLGLWSGAGPRPETLQAMLVRLGRWPGATVGPAAPPDMIADAGSPSPGGLRTSRAILEAIVQILDQLGLLRPLSDLERAQILDRLEADLLALEAGGDRADGGFVETAAGPTTTGPGAPAPHGAGEPAAEDFAEAAGLTPAHHGATAPPDQGKPAAAVPAGAAQAAAGGNAAGSALYAELATLIDRLGLWAVSRPVGEPPLVGALAGVTRQAGMRDSLSIHATASALLDALVREGLLRPVGEADRARILRELTIAVVPSDTTHPAASRGEPTDAEQGAEAACGPVLPRRPAGAGPTPRQRELLADLARALASVRLQAAAPESTANALLLYAALIDHAPRWAGDPLATGTIRRLLEAWGQLERAAAPDELMRQLRAPAAARTATGGGEPPAALRLLAGLGEPGLALVARLRQQGDDHALPPTRRPGAVSRPAQSAETAVVTGCAGCFLMLRAALDARLHALAARADRDAGKTVGALLVALGLRWAGPEGLVGGELDPGLVVLAGLPGEVRPASLRTTLAVSDSGRLQSALLESLDGLRVLRGAEAHLFRVSLPDASEGLVLGDESGGLWPIGRALTAEGSAAATCAELLELWEAATGQRPALVAPESLLVDLGWDTAPAPVLAVPDVPGQNDAAGPAARYWEERARLLAALDALWASWPELPAFDLPLTLAAGALVHLWARWLSAGFARSTVPYLLATMIRRPGRVQVDARGITVELEPRPLDVVVKLARYTDDIEQVPWLGSRRVRFRIRG